MAKKTSGVQIEMLLPIVSKSSTQNEVRLMDKPKTLTYEKVMASLRAKGLTRAVTKK